MTTIRVQPSGSGDRDMYSSGGQSNVVADYFVMELSGWISRIGAYVGGTDASNPTNIQLGLWAKDEDGNGPHRRVFDGNVQLTGVMAWRNDNIPNGIKLTRDQTFLVGFGSNYGEIRRWRVKDAPDPARDYHLMYSEDYRVPPVFAFQAARDGILVCYYDYVPNKRPLRGSWVRPDTPDTTQANPLWTGTMPHNPEEEGFDSSQSVRARIFDMTAGGGIIFDTTFDTTASERANGQWNRRLTELVPGRRYEAEFLHSDSFGWSSPMSERKSLRINTGPNAPADPSVSGKINTLTPQVTVRYSHAQNIAGNRMLMVVRSAETNAAVDRVIVTPSNGIANNSTVAINTPNGILKWGKAYDLVFLAVDVNGLPGDNTIVRVKTNSFPSTPTSLSPQAGSIESEGRFSAYVEDPDGDPVVSARTTISSVQSGQVVIGPVLMTRVQTETGYALSANIDLSSLTLGASYSYQVDASDAVGKGSASSPIIFTYARVPSAVIIAPSSRSRVNLIPRPGAELAPENFAPYWTVSGGDPLVDSIEEFADEDSAEGLASYRAIIGNGVGFEMRGDFRNVDASRALLFRAKMKKEFASGVSASKVYLQCFTAANESLGTVYPVGGAAVGSAGVDLPDGWTEFWGVIGPEGSTEYGSSLPVGTKRVQPVWEPGSSAPVVVRADSFWLEKLPLASSLIKGSPADFFSYIPISFFGYGSNDLYSETQVPQGVEKSGPGIANNPSPMVLIDYVSPDGVDKVADRLVIKREQSNGTFAVVYSGDWFTGAQDSPAARESIPMPPSVLQNEGRYSIRVYVRDANGIEGYSPETEFDTIFNGPPQVQISNVEPRAENAEIRISIQGSDLPEQEFGGIEVARRLPSGLIEVFDFVPTQDVFESVYNFPVSGEVNRFLVRQISLKNGQEIQGRWTTADGVVEYKDWWIKDVLRSGADLPIRVLSADEISLTSSSPELASFRPLGSPSRSYVSSPSLQESSQLVLRIFDNDPDKNRKVELAESLRREPRVVCILSHRPSDKVFARIAQVNRVSAHVPLYAVYTFEWSEAGYSEDYYARSVQ